MRRVNEARTCRHDLLLPQTSLLAVLGSPELPGLPGLLPVALANVDLACCYVH